MTNYPSDFDTARAIRDARDGSMVASVALMTITEDPKAAEWPYAFRQTALDQYRIEDKF